MRKNITNNFKELNLSKYAEIFFNDTTGNFEFFYNGELEETRYDDGNFEEIKRWVVILDGIASEKCEERK